MRIRGVPARSCSGRAGDSAHPVLLQDSGAYFLQLLWNVYATPGYDRTQLLREPVVFEAASVLVDGARCHACMPQLAVSPDRGIRLHALASWRAVWTIEQHHEEKSVYRYAELPRNGLGPPCNYTGMSWSGFRPSDDQQVHCYNVPVNMYAAAALERALELNAHIWRSESFEQRATKLLEGIQQGGQAFHVATRASCSL